VFVGAIDFSNIWVPLRQLICVAVMLMLNTMVTNQTPDFVDRLNAALDAANYPAGKGRRVMLARLMGVSGEAARKWLTGESLPSMKNIRRFAGLFGYSVDWLLAGRGAMYPVEASPAENVDGWGSRPDGLTDDEWVVLRSYRASTIRGRKFIRDAAEITASSLRRLG